jgi:hypothetical protein
MFATDELFTASEAESAIGLTANDLKNLTRPECGYLPSRHGKPMTVAYVARAYALRIFRDEAGLALWAAADAAEAVAPILMHFLKLKTTKEETEPAEGTFPRLVFVSGAGRLVPVPTQAITSMPVPGMVCHLFDAQHAALFVKDRLQDVIDKRDNKVRAAKKRVKR